MAINGQVGNSTNLSDQDGSAVLTFEELGHGGANNYLPGRQGKFFIYGTTFSDTSSVNIQTGFEQATIIEVEFIVIEPVTDGAGLQVQFYEAGTLEDQGVYDNARYKQDSSNNVSFTNDSANADIPLGEVGNGTGEAYCGTLTICHANNSATQTSYYARGVGMNADPELECYEVGGELPQASVVDGIKVFFSSGNIASGKLKMDVYA